MGSRPLRSDRRRPVLLAAAAAAIGVLGALALASCSAAVAFAAGAGAAAAPARGEDAAALEASSRRSLLASSLAAAAAWTQGTVGASAEEEKVESDNDPIKSKYIREWMTRNKNADKEVDASKKVMPMFQGDTKQIVRDRGPKMEMPYDKYTNRLLDLNALPRDTVLFGYNEKSGTGRTVNGFPWDNELPGVYKSVVSDVPLFSSADKYDAGQGMAVFKAPIDDSRIFERMMERKDGRKLAEVLDRYSMSHVGYVQKEPNNPSGKRYLVKVTVMNFDAMPNPPSSR